MSDKNYLNNKNTSSIITLSFLIIELMIYVTFMYVDITEKYSYQFSSNLKFIGIVICFLYTIINFYKISGRPDLVLLRGALFFTVLSDFFILILDHYSIGVLTFCIVQILYLIRIFLWKKLIYKDVHIWSAILRNGIVITLSILLLVVLKFESNILIYSSIIYFVCFFFNVIDAILIAIKSKERYIIVFTIGLVLFILCDINVGLFNISNFISIEGAWFSKVYQFASIAMWMFYLPAQVGIALSGKINLKR